MSSRFATTNANVDSWTLVCMFRPPRRPPHGRYHASAGRLFSVSMQVSTVDASRPMCWWYIGA